VTRGKSSIGKENRLAKPLVAEGEDLALNIQARKISSVSSAHAPSEAGCQYSTTTARAPAELHRLRHHRRQSLRPEAELWYSATCFGLCGKVKSPAWRMRHASNSAIVGSSRRLPIPFSQQSGRTVIGPKTPKLPHRAAKLEPISSSPRKAPSAAAGSARHLSSRDPSRRERPSGSGRPELGPESETEHPVGLGEIRFEQRANGDLHSLAVEPPAEPRTLAAHLGPDHPDAMAGPALVPQIRKGAPERPIAAPAVDHLVAAVI